VYVFVLPYIRKLLNSREDAQLIKKNISLSEAE
jgi:hypothetical protein